MSGRKPSGEKKKRKRDDVGKFRVKNKDDDDDDEDDEEVIMLKRDSVQVPDPGCSGPMVAPHRSAAELQREMRDSAQNPTPEQVGVGLAEPAATQENGGDPSTPQQLQDPQGSNNRQGPVGSSQAATGRTGSSAVQGNPPNNSDEAGPSAVPRRVLPEPGTRAWTRVMNSVDGVTQSRHSLINTRPVGMTSPERERIAASSNR